MTSGERECLIHSKLVVKCVCDGGVVLTGPKECTGERTRLLRPLVTLGSERSRKYETFPIGGM